MIFRANLNKMGIRWPSLMKNELVFWLSFNGSSLFSDFKLFFSCLVPLQEAIKNEEKITLFFYF
jgi:hypothetical protein